MSQSIQTDEPTHPSGTSRGRVRLAAEIAGWYGAGAIVGAYLLVSFSVLDAESVAYQLLNLTGALGVIAISAVNRVRQSVVLNAFWAVIAILALIRVAIPG